MSPAHHQALVLGGLCLAGFVLMVMLPSSRRTRFGVFAALNFLLAAALFGAQAVFGFAGWRSEILAASLSELPVVFLLSWVCLAQAGCLPARVAAPPAEAAVRHPRLRTTLKTAPVILLSTWGCAVVLGLVWPSPAMQAYAPAPPQFVLFKWSISSAEGFYAGLAALVFLLASRSAASVRALRLKNLAFAVSMLCLAFIAIESAILAGVRLWGSDEGRRATVQTLLVLEAYAAALCFLMLVLGLTLRYTPAVASTLLRLHVGWLPARERLESLRWRTVAGGRARGMIRASQYVTEAATLQGLSRIDVERALTTIQLIATLNDPSAERARVTPEAARKLYELQKEVLSDEVLASKINWTTGWDSRASEPHTVKDALLHEALEAALDLIDVSQGRGADPQGPQPLWYHLAAVSAADARLIDPEAVDRHLGGRPEHHAALEAYRATELSLRSRTVDDR